MAKVHITKLDAARRQLETAIRLYFHNGDIVSIHTLASAAHEIVDDLAKAKNVERTLFKGMVLDYILPEHQKKWFEALNEAQNYFKHADRDHQKVIQFEPRTTELTLFDSVDTYARISGEHTSLMKIFMGWFVIRHKEFFKKDAPVTFKDAMSGIADGYGEADRLRYFNDFLPVIMRAGM